ncbi:MAG: hypothetical protein WC721_06775 [Victivallaceae bacterium]
MCKIMGEKITRPKWVLLLCRPCRTGLSSANAGKGYGVVRASLVDASSIRAREGCGVRASL